MSLAAPNLKTDRRIRIMHVDDSAVVRALTRRWIEEDPRFELVRSCIDGEQAIAQAATAKPDVIILDVEMPKMDGLAALPGLRKAAPQARVIMASTLTSRGASTTVRALGLGAADYIAKPDSKILGSADTYRRELVEKMLALGGRAVNPVTPASRKSNYQLRTPKVRTGLAGRPSVMVVASSTGGPAALQAFLGPIARRISAPILIVQHMPRSFTKIFAEKLGEHVGRPCREPIDHDPIMPGSMFLAPGDFHMRIAKSARGHEIRLDQGAQVHFCRPAADPLFESAASIYGGRVLGVVLTGMGSDGAAGSGRVVEAGGRVIVQDEASSVVWGMPGSVAQAGYAEAIKPLPELGSMALSIMNGEG